VELESLVPFPNCPSPLDPQQSTLLVASSAQASLPLTAVATALVMAETATGTSLSTVVPLPSCPKSLTPQHSAFPVLRTAQPSPPLNPIAVALVMPLTGTGVVLHEFSKPP